MGLPGREAEIIQSSTSDRASQSFRKKREQEELSGKEIERLRGLIGSLEKSSGACSLALSGKSLLSFGLHISEKGFESLWIINSGATTVWPFHHNFLVLINRVQAIGKFL